MHVNDLLHRGRIGKLDVVEEAAAQKRVWQFFFVVGGDEHQRAMFGFDELACFVHVELHAVDLTQQIVRELDIGFVDFINQQSDGLIRCESLPQHAFDDVVVDVFDLLATVDGGQLRVTQAAHGVVFVQTLLRFGGGFDVPLQERNAQCGGHFLRQHGLSSARLAFDQKRFLQGGCGIDGEHQVIGGDVVFRTLEFHTVDFLKKAKRVKTG